MYSINLWCQQPQKTDNHMRNVLDTEMEYEKKSYRVTSKHDVPVVKLSVYGRFLQKRS